MRIAMLGHKRIPSREGGVEVVVEDLSTRMAALGHDVTVYSRKGHNVAGSEHDRVFVSEYKGVTIKEVSTLDIRGLAALTSSYFATKAAIADKPDVIHFHAEGPCVMVPMAEKAGIRTVATIHGLDWRRAKWGRIASGYIKHGERTAAKYADEVIVLSRSVQGYFEGAYGRSTTFIPNGVDAKARIAPQVITERYGLAKDSYVLYLGRIVSEKGLHYLIEAFKRIGTDKKLVVAGGSSDSDFYYKKMAEAAKDDPRILFTGYVEGREFEELFSNALVYVLPSDLEGMPMSLLEAMAYGRCCLTSDIHECSDVIGDTGVTFRKGDVADLRLKLEKLIVDSRVRESFGKAASKRVATSFGWDPVVSATLAVYENERR